MDKIPNLLVLDDDDEVHLIVEQVTRGRFHVSSAHTGAEALALLKNGNFQVFFLDIELGGGESGLELLPRILQLDPEVSVVIVSGRSDFPTMQSAMRKGATDYISKTDGLDPEEILMVLQRVLDRRRMTRRFAQVGQEAIKTHQEHVLIGQSAQIAELRRTIEKVRRTQANVLILGETGTGKEVIARQLRTTLEDGTPCPFIAVDSATIQSTMAESMLFGHEKGAFTGAERANKGIFEEANEGIVYFDEIANMPNDIQNKLLRVLQEKVVTRLGSTRVIPLEFRVISASNRRLEDLIKSGQFKEDLYQRLAVLPIEAPPLRKRAGDIPLLLDHFVLKHARVAGTIRFRPEVIEVLKEYAWPGNVRELSNFVAYAITMSDSGEIGIDDLPPKLRQAAMAIGDLPEARAPEAASDETFYDQVARFERGVLQREFARYGKNVRNMASHLHMDRAHLYRKLKIYGIYGDPDTQGDGHRH